MRANLSMPTAVIIPVLDYTDVLAAVTWLEEAFGFEVRLRIEAHLSCARRHGARIIRDLEEFPYGERQYSCLDPAGHSWTFSETIRNVDPARWGGVLAPRRPDLRSNRSRPQAACCDGSRRRC
jgi:uncharacterized glyoxalase superfamily protein PhnB